MIQGPKVKSNEIIINGPSSVQIKVVIQGEMVNQDSNLPRFCTFSVFLLVCPFQTLAIESFPIPE